MKLNKILFSLMAAFSLVAVSCQEELAYTPGEQDLAGCHGVYFPTQDASGDHTMDPSETPAIDIVVKRTSEDGDITVPVEVIASEEGIFNVPELKFVDGQTEATLHVTFDKAKGGVDYSLTLQVSDPEYASKYGANPTYITFNVIIEKYDLLGKATIREGLITGYQQNPTGIEWEVEVYTKDTTPGWYYFKDAYISAPFNQGWENRDGWNMMPSGSYLSINAENPARVYMPFQNLGCNWSYGWMYAGSLAPEAGISGGTPAYGTLVDGVISFPANGMVFGETEYNNFAIDLTNTEGTFRICLPGAILVDYTISLKSGYSNNGQHPVAFTFGADVATIKYAAYAGPLKKEELTEKVAELVADKNAKKVSKPAADAEGNVPAAVVNLSFPTTGEYTVVAVGCDKDGNAQSTTSLVITYVAADDEVPVVIAGGLGSAAKYAPEGISTETAVEFYLYGEDIKALKVGLFGKASITSQADLNACLDAVYKSTALPAAILEEVNTGTYVDVFTKLSPGTEYVMIVYASNGYEEKFIMTNSWTTDGDPLPIYRNFTINDIKEDLLPAASDGYFGTYNYYVKDWDEDGNLIPLRDYRGKVTISDSEVPDSDPDEYGLVSEYVDVEGLVYYASQAGMSTKVTFEYYGGVLYTINQPMGNYLNKYYIYLYAFDNEAGKMYNVPLLGGFVDEGYIAFVNAYASQGLNINGFILAAFADADYTQFVGGGVDALVDILLVDPEVDDNGIAPKSAKMGTMSMADLKKVNFNLSSEINCVETERGRIHSAIDQMRAEKAVQSVGTIAGVKGEWSAPAVEFTAEEAAPEFQTITTDFSNVKHVETEPLK